MLHGRPQVVFEYHGRRDIEHPCHPHKTLRLNLSLDPSSTRPSEPLRVIDVAGSDLGSAASWAGLVLRAFRTPCTAKLPYPAADDVVRDVCPTVCCTSYEFVGPANDDVAAGATEEVGMFDPAHCQRLACIWTQWVILELVLYWVESALSARALGLGVERWQCAVGGGCEDGEAG